MQNEPKKRIFARSKTFMTRFSDGSAIVNYPDGTSAILEGASASPAALRQEILELAEMTTDGFAAFVAELVRRGHPAEYAALIGDVIETDENGKWIVRDNSGKIIDRIDPLP